MTITTHNDGQAAAHPINEGRFPTDVVDHWSARPVGVRRSEDSDRKIPLGVRLQEYLFAGHLAAAVVGVRILWRGFDRG